MASSVTPKQKELSKLTKEQWREYTKTVWHIPNVTHPDHPAVFPEELPRRLIQLFSFYGETVLDPFGGVGTTAKAGIPLGRKVVCVDQNRSYVATMRRECKKILAEAKAESDAFTALHGDSRDLSEYDDGVIDLIATSPPYWNKANYGKGKNNLGGITSYTDFLDAIRPVFEECFRVLRPGRKFCINTANVNQHTDHGLLTFPLATDFAVMARDVGFVMVNEIIWSKDKTGGRWGSANGQRPIFGSYPYPPNFLFKNVHEYVLIFAKPPARKTKGPKVVPYEKLMKRTTKRGKLR